MNSSNAKSPRRADGEALPLLALTVGDPAGIGPEITPPALVALSGRARIVVLGPSSVRPDDVPLVSSPEAVTQAAPVGWMDTGGPGVWTPGEVQSSCGAAAVAALRQGHEWALEGRVEALVTGPVNKAALRAAGTKVEGQTELLSQWCGVTRSEMIGLAGNLRVMLATRHMPLRQAIDRITVEHVIDRLLFLDEALRYLGHPDPLLGLAGLNPHAGEGGLLGSEEGEILAPAVDVARARGLRVAGPVSPDTIFAEGVAGKYTGILALYHDQAFIPLKLMAAGRGVTFIAGLPYGRFSPMHGTAFDIVGRKGEDGLPLADPGNLVAALEAALTAVARRAE
ncbi:4-hydroxythreonine-4-phosphate dehydrogenase [Planctomycetes bacterium Poly30]|uniref:4-hydroxythreonine-4-phosphate dehydrogenase n=1 Tax=Saltatorellus ferox TaxID=2528018 RepID=A0A518EX69_9BACT|nr:4-hydroxythreonine-4-phosphate dehydrogenase [Planctomycetes bacterium Poly30]